MKQELLNDLTDLLRYSKGKLEAENKLSDTMCVMSSSEYELVREEIINQVFTICPLLELAVIHYKSSRHSIYLGITYEVGGRHYIDYEIWGCPSIHGAFTGMQGAKCLFNNECTQQQLREVHRYLELYVPYFEASYCESSHLLVEQHLITKVRAIREVNLASMYP